MARFAYTLYSIAVAHANDHAKPEDFVKVSGGLLLLYGFGTMIGPVHRRGADGLDAARKACSWRPRSPHFLLAGYTLLRITPPRAGAARGPRGVQDAAGRPRRRRRKRARLDPRTKPDESRVEPDDVDRHFDCNNRVEIRADCRKKAHDPADAFMAIADPNRRYLLEELGAVRRRSTSSRRAAGVAPAVSQHLKVLLDAGLVSAGRRAQAHLRRQRARLHEAEHLAGSVLGGMNFTATARFGRCSPITAANANTSIRRHGAAGSVGRAVGSVLVGRW